MSAACLKAVHTANIYAMIADSAHANPLLYVNPNLGQTRQPYSSHHKIIWQLALLGHDRGMLHVFTQ